MNILIVGYGNIGKHIYEEFKSLQPDIYDPFIPEYRNKRSFGYAQDDDKRYDFAFICVPTDMLPDGSCDTSIVEQVVSETKAGVIVIKSTVPLGTTKRLVGATDKNIVFSPEHYGTTQHCKPDPGFVILGGEKEYTAKVAELYGKVKSGYYKIHFTDATTAELSKYMLNSFLALKVTFCNEFADIAGKFDVSYPELRELFVADERVGASHTFVYPDKPYYDSHCFNKDVPALVQFAGDSAPLMSFVNERNISEKSRNSEKQEPLVSCALDEKIVAQAEKDLAEYQAGIIQAEQEIERIQSEERNAFIVFAESGRSDEAGRELKAIISMREERQLALEALKAEYFQARKINLKNAIAQKSFQYDCSICLIIRDENEYLEEWLNWHIGQGVEHFYIYDHGSKEPVEQFMQSLNAEIAEKVTVIDWSGPHDNAQPDAYNDCLGRFGNESKWIGFIDTDEHVRVKTGQSLPEFLKAYEEYAGVFAVWNTLGADGERYKSNFPLRERFTKGVPLDLWAHKAGKVFVQPSLMKDIVIHNGHPIDGFDVVDEYKDIVPEAQMLKENATTDLICVDHFYTKSYEEWLEKLRRGRGHFDHARKYEEFFEYNPDMEYCREEVFPTQEYEISNKDTCPSVANKSLEEFSPVQQEKLQNRDFKYSCSICLIIRDENEYLEEWLRWHIGQGVQHFYIYDHDSREPVKPFVQSLGAEVADKVTVINWSGLHDNAQPEAYNDCLQRFGTDNKWIGFIDADEHVRVKTMQPLPEFLKGYEDYAGVFAVWHTYGANGQKEKSDKPLRERFQTLATNQNYGLGKVFVQPCFMRSMYIHNGCAVEGYAIVGEHKDIVPDEQIRKENPTTDLICVDHFFTKSYEEWLEKLKRGRCHVHFNRKYDEFFYYNPDMCDCREDIQITQEYEKRT